MTELVAELAGGRPGPGLARVAADASGNPLYLTELVGSLDRSGGLAVAGGIAEFATGPARVTPATLNVDGQLGQQRDEADRLELGETSPPPR